MKTHYSKVRIGVVSLLFAMAFVVFFARLVFVQVVQGDRLRERARRQYLQSIELPAERGEIFDIKGSRVAVNTSFKSLFAYPLSRGDVDESYRMLASLLRSSRSRLKREYHLAPKEFRWIKRGLEPSELARFEKHGVGRGLFLREEPTRQYPYGDIGRAILGFVDLDNRGQSGVELVMNDYLTGSPGMSFIQRNGIGEEYRIREIPLKEPLAGNSVVLTVDWDKQQIVEEELARGIADHNAKGGMAIFIDPHTGAILAAAGFGAEEQSTDKPMKLSPVSDIFEPGSIYKLITAAAALESGRIKPDDRFYAENGSWRMGRRRLRDDHEYDTLTFREAFEFSSNIVMGKIANEIGADKVFAMAQKLAFGRKTRCGLNGESGGILVKPRRWSQFTTATFAIGHGVSVTPLQMAQAFGVVAAGGYLAQPHIIAGCINDEDKIIERHRSRPVKVLDDVVVEMLDSFLRGVVERGTGKPVAGTPFAIAAKTGTAEKPNLESGGYYKNAFMASFAGYFPADSPLVAGIVVLDEPEPIHYGGYTAGPVFRNIAVKFAAIDKYDLPAVNALAGEIAEDLPVEEPGAPTVRLPDLAGVSRDKARYELHKRGLDAEFSGPGGMIVGTRPAAFTWIEPGTAVYCYVAPEEPLETEAPDLTGLTIREAVVILKEYGLSWSCTGVGRVVSQVPRPGEAVAAGDRITLTCERKTGA